MKNIFLLKKFKLQINFKNLEKQKSIKLIHFNQDFLTNMEKASKNNNFFFISLFTCYKFLLTMRKLKKIIN